MESMEPMQPVQPVEVEQPEQPVKPKKAKKIKKEKNPKKVLAIVLAVVIAFVSIFSIAFYVSTNLRIAKLESDNEYYKQMFNYYNYLIESGQIVLEEGSAPSFDEFNQNNPIVDNGQDELPSNDQQNNSQQDNQPQSADPTQWTVAQIVETYKHAAGRTHNSVTSYQQMTLRKNSLKAPGINDTLVNLTAGVMEQVLENNSMDVKGITGGHQNLVVSDVQSARAYKKGSNTVIEMVMKEQVDKGNGNMYSGTVGHAISVVGPINNVVGQFSSLGVDAKIADSDATLHYKNPILRVSINNQGTIVNGTWSYYVDVTLNNMVISGFGLTVPVPQATAVIDFIVTLNGGFKG